VKKYVDEKWLGISKMNKALLFKIVERVRVLIFKQDTKYNYKTILVEKVPMQFRVDHVFVLHCKLWKGAIYWIVIGI
jgi:hypothetical protein